MAARISEWRRCEGVAKSRKALLGSWIASMVPAAFFSVYGDGVLWWLGFIWVFAPQFVIAFALGPRKGVRRLIEAKSGVERFHVDVLFTQMGEETGWDEGVLWQENGLLCFEGLKSEFALSPEAVRVDPLDEGSGQTDPGVALVVRHLEKQLDLRLIAARRVLPDGKLERKPNLVGSVAAWKDAGSAPDDSQTLPPFGLEPSVIASPRQIVLWIAGLLATVAVAIGIEQFASRRHPDTVHVGSAVIAVGFVAIIGFGAIWSMAARTRRLRALFPDDPVFKTAA